jgi:hypothetical protein
LKSYAGIGSRETPIEILEVMKVISRRLYNGGFTLRSGGAKGADQAFESALIEFEREDAQKQVEIYLPWPGFEKQTRLNWFEPKRKTPQPEAFTFSSMYHPGWNYLSDFAKSLHARNTHQILGYDITNPDLVDFVVCWTKNGKISGGTGQALRIAEAHNIEIYNLAIRNELSRLIKERAGKQWFSLEKV